MTVEVCPRCGAYRYEGRWYPPPLEASSLEDVVKEVLKLVLTASFKPNSETVSYRIEQVEYIRDPYHGDYALVKVVGRLHGFEEEYSKEYSVRVSIRKRLCPQCLKKAGGAVEAILQVRGEGGRLTEEQRKAVEKLLDSLSPLLREYVSDVVEQREGFDLILVDQGVAKMIAAKIRSALGARVIESWKLVGRYRNGRPKRRLTLSVRLPFYSPGSLVEYHGALYRVERIKNGHVYVRLIGSQRVHRLTVDEAWRLLRKPRFEEESRILIVAETPRALHVQKLDSGYEYLELPRREVRVDDNVAQAGGEAILVRVNGRYYVLPLEEA